VRRIEETDDPAEILRLTAFGTARVRRARWRVLAILLDNRTADPDVGAAADAATRVVRDRLDLVAARLVETGGLAAGLDVGRVSEVLWFYFGFEAWRTARGLGWEWDDAAAWLASQAASALLPDRVT